MSNVSKDRIKQLLGNGLSNEVVASTIGVHPSYITQLMSDEEFNREVIELRTKTLTSHTIRDRSLDAIEDKLINAIADRVDDHSIYKPSDLLHAFRIVNGAKRRGVDVAQSTVINNHVVNLALRQQTVLSFKTNSVNEVVEVEGQTMVTMQASSLLEKLAASKAGTPGAAKYEKAKRFLPAGSLTPGKDQSKVLEHLESSSSEGNPINVREQRERLEA